MADQAERLAERLERGCEPVDGQEHLRCPITLAMYQDPVVIESGNTYERSAILLHWARRGQPHDPLNNTSLTSDIILNNWDKRRQVQDFLVRRRALCPDYLPEGWDSVNVQIPPPPSGTKQVPSRGFSFSRGFCRRAMFLMWILMAATFLIVGYIIAVLRTTAPSKRSMFIGLAGPGSAVENFASELLGHPKDSRVQVQALAALALLAKDNSENRATIMQGDGIRPILSAMGDHLEDPEMQALFCWALGNLACNSETNSAQIARAGGVQHIIASSREHIKDASVQTAALWALWNLSIHSGLSRTAIASARGVDQILAVMRLHLQEARVQTHACGALWSLTVDRDRRQAIASTAINSLVEAIIEHPDCDQLQVQACGALRDLTSSATFENAVVEAFWNSKAHGAALGTEKGLVGAPWNLDITKAHKEWLKSLIDTPMALASHCRALWNTTSGQFDNRASRIWVDGVSRLVAAMDQHSRNHTKHSMRRLEH